VAVLPAEYPQVILSHGDLSVLEKAIMDEISVTGWSTVVAFSGIHFRVGHLVIAPRLSSWKGVSLDVRVGDNIPSPPTMIALLPEERRSEFRQLAGHSGQPEQVGNRGLESGFQEK